MESDFWHLEPVERVYVARHRMAKLSEVLREVWQLNEQKKAFVTSRFFKSGQKHEAVQLLFETVVHYEIVQVCRLWDDVDTGGFSLPAIASLLEGDDVRQVLSARGETGVTVSLPGSHPSDEFLKEVFDPALKEAKNAEKKSEEIKRIKRYRNKYIAHPLFSTREGRKNHQRKNFLELRADDVERAVQIAVPIVEVFANALSVARHEHEHERNRIKFSKDIMQPFYAALKYPF